MNDPLPLQDGNIRPIRPAAGREGLNIQDHIPPNEQRLTMAETLIQYLEQNGPSRGAMDIDRAGSNQTMPGVSIPVWLATILNMLAADPRLPYGHDRQTLHRDLLWLGAYAYADIMGRQDDLEEHDPAHWPMHIVHIQESLRRSAYEAEQRLYIIDSLIPIIDTLAVEVQANATSSVYRTMSALMKHPSTADPRFWRPAIQRAIFSFPEVRQAMRHLHDSNYAFTEDFQAWAHIQEQMEQ